MNLKRILGWGVSGILSVGYLTANAAVRKEQVILNNAAVPLANKNWPGWRGYNTSGISEGGDLPVKWVKDGKVDALWVADVPGRGESSPVVWNDFVCLTYSLEAEPPERESEDEPPVQERGELHAACWSNANGKLKWDKKLQAVQGTKHHLNSFASSTPTTDGTNLYVAVGFESGALYALNLDDGSQVWKQVLGDMRHEYGTSVGPILYRDSVILLCDAEHESSLRAFDKKTGAVKWKTPRKSTGSWGTPVLVTTKAGDQIIVPGGSPTRWVDGYVRGYHPSTGKELWNVSGTTAYVCTSPILGEKQIYCASGRPTGPIVALRPEAENEDERIAWKDSKGGAYIPTGVYYRDQIYMISDTGVFAAYEPKEADVNRIFQTRIGGDFTSSLLAGDGRVYAFDLEGKATVFQAGKTSKVLAVNEMPEPIWATPAISEGRFYIRTETQLFKIGRKD